MLSQYSSCMLDFVNLKSGIHGVLVAHDCKMLALFDLLIFTAPIARMYRFCLVCVRVSVCLSGPKKCI